MKKGGHYFVQNEAFIIQAANSRALIGTQHAEALLPPVLAD